MSIQEKTAEPFDTSISLARHPPPIEVKTIDGERGIVFNWHRGQRRAMESTKRIVAIIAGGRSGKTTIGPAWLHREMIRKGPGDYLVAGPDYRILDRAATHDIRTYFQSLLKFGELRGGQQPQFTFSVHGCKALWGHVPTREPRILFGHAAAPESLEAMSCKAAWLDEAGQGKFKLESWEAIGQRLAVDEGRALITSKPYNLGWLKQKVYDAWTKAGKNHPYIDVIEFDARMNPVFPMDEWHRQKANMQPWKFAMHYLGKFTRPAGMIYDCFDNAETAVGTPHVVPAFKLDDRWPRYLGLDFGGVNTAGIFLAEDPQSKKLYAYHEYHAGGRTAKEHVEKLLKVGPRPRTIGGSKSEGQWRAEFAAAGLAVEEPDQPDVEVGIGRVYAAIKTGGLYVFETLSGLRDELGSYSRPLDDKGDPVEGIEDKEQYHRLDALRYVVSKIRRGSSWDGKIGTSRSTLADRLPEW